MTWSLEHFPRDPHDSNLRRLKSRDASELLDELSVRIYDPPLSQLRDDGRIADVSRPICVAMLLIDYDTECSINGILNFLGNSTRAHVPETVLALRTIDRLGHADTLDEIYRGATDAGMTYAAVQNDGALQTEFAVTTFHETHGESGTVLAIIRCLADRIASVQGKPPFLASNRSRRHALSPSIPVPVHSPTAKGTSGEN